MVKVGSMVFGDMLGRLGTSSQAYCVEKRRKSFSSEANDNDCWIGGTLELSAIAEERFFTDPTVLEESERPSLPYDEK
jgi:hypothetical protein